MNLNLEFNFKNKPSNRDAVIERLKADGKNADYIKSYMKGWDAVGASLKK